MAGFSVDDKRLKREASGSRLSFGRSGWLELLMARRNGETAANRDAMAMAALAGPGEKQLGQGLQGMAN